MLYNQSAFSVFLKLVVLCITVYCQNSLTTLAEDRATDLPQRVRSILSNRCFACHGPDDAERQGGLRLDQHRAMLAAADSGKRPVVAGDAQQSELMRRIASGDSDERMPPPEFGKPLEAAEVATIEAWIMQGAKLPEHWSFVAPVRPILPEITGDIDHVAIHPVDMYVKEKLSQRGMRPSPPATRSELLRRLSLDLIGLPPTIEEVADFERDNAPDAYERQVDRLLASPAYGEHWARKWLDLARYADSAGYADDPDRTIWPYRDWVIDALNDNMPIDQFTIEQLAGDLLPNPTQRQLVATAFHRNTLTNNEGGTNDEEFRSVAIVDRVNTTMAVWMGVTMACAQCHTHKYDPFTQEEYFQLYAILNQTQDADRRDESPVLELFTSQQQLKQQQWRARIDELQKQLTMPSAESLVGFDQWQSAVSEPEWEPLQPLACDSQRDSDVRFEADQSIQVRPTANNIVSDTYTLKLQLPGDQSRRVRALGLRTLPRQELPVGGAGTSPGGGNFVITGVNANVTAAQSALAGVRYVRVDLPGKDKILSLAEVQLFVGQTNVALNATATQSSTAFDGQASRATDGETDGDYARNSTTHTGTEANPWWECELSEPQAVERVAIWNRTGVGLAERLNGATLKLLDGERNVLFEHTIATAPEVSQSLAVVPRRAIHFLAAHADFAQHDFPASQVVDSDAASGWAVGGDVANSHLLTLIPVEPFDLEPGATVELQIEHNSAHRHHLLGSFRVETSASDFAKYWSLLDPAIVASLAISPEQRSPEQCLQLQQFYCQHVAPELEPQRAELFSLQKQLSELKPETSVPILRELAADSRRETFVQIRGNYKSLGAKVEAGVPAVFHPIQHDSEDTERDSQNTVADVDRLALAQWLVDRRNPLTARVWVNRLWESLFGIGIVRTSEEFGAQGDMPTHPELLDWLACELMDQQWDHKRLLKLLVTSETYQQTSRVTHEGWLADQENVWLARGPRVRLSAEMVRDQALAVAGLLTDKMYGAAVRPPQPNLGLKAAFGSDTDWQTSAGEDRYRRGLYTSWRRSNPYPSMATFDAPSREVCTLRRDSTNTPLQALVTLNDPAFVEAAQGLARRVALFADGELAGDEAKLQKAFLLCTSRQATLAEAASLLDLLDRARGHFASQPQAAKQLSSDPLGPLASQAQEIELAAWTTVCNVLLNLDEVLLKR